MDPVVSGGGTYGNQPALGGVSRIPEIWVLAPSPAIRLVIRLGRKGLQTVHFRRPGWSAGLYLY